MYFILSFSLWVLAENWVRLQFVCTFNKCQTSYDSTKRSLNWKVFWLYRNNDQSLIHPFFSIHSNCSPLFHLIHSFCVSLVSGISFFNIKVIRFSNINLYSFNFESNLCKILSFISFTLEKMPNAYRLRGPPVLQ